MVTFSSFSVPLSNGLSWHHPTTDYSIALALFSLWPLFQQSLQFPNGRAGGDDIVHYDNVLVGHQCSGEDFTVILSFLATLGEADVQSKLLWMAALIFLIWRTTACGIATATTIPQHHNFCHHFQTISNDSIFIAIAAATVPDHHNTCQYFGAHTHGRTHHHLIGKVCCRSPHPHSWSRNSCQSVIWKRTIVCPCGMLELTKNMQNIVFCVENLARVLFESVVCTKL